MHGNVAVGCADGSNTNRLSTQQMRTFIQWKIVCKHAIFARHFYGRAAAAAVAAAGMGTEAMKIVAEKVIDKPINIDIESGLKCYHIDLCENDRVP